MAQDLYTVGFVTVFGANGTVSITGLTAVSGGDINSLDLTDNVTVIEQKNGLGNTSGAVGIDQRDDLTLTFYPFPSTTTSPSDLQYKAITLPALFGKVTIASGTVSTQTPAGVVVTRIAKDYSYVGGGSISQTEGGLLRMTLPLRKWNQLTP